MTDFIVGTSTGQRTTLISLLRLTTKMPCECSSCPQALFLLWEVLLYIFVAVARELEKNVRVIAYENKFKRKILYCVVTVMNETLIL